MHLGKRAVTLSRDMQDVTGKYVDYFNGRYRRSGHLFKGRFDAQLVEEETYLPTVARYILNPVRARMVEVPEEWRWSSYRARPVWNLLRPGYTRTLSWIVSTRGTSRQRQRCTATSLQKRSVNRVLPS